MKSDEASKKVKRHGICRHLGQMCVCECVCVCAHVCIPNASSLSDINYKGIIPQGKT